MIKTTYQTPELRNANDEIVQEGAFGKNTALSNSDNTGWIDYVVNNLEALHDTIGDSAAHLDGNGHVVEPANLAIGDEDGNRLKTSYLKLSGGTVSGTLNVRQNLKIQDNQENVFGGFNVPASSATSQYLQIYGGENSSAGNANMVLFPSGDGRFQITGYNTNGSATYRLDSDNNGNLNWRGYPLAWKKDYLPLTGGTLSGWLQFSNEIGRIQVNRSSTGNDGVIQIYGGSGYSTGAYLWLNGVGKTNQAGYFGLRAVTNGSTYKELQGRPDGTLLWGGNSIALSKDVLPLAGGTMTGAITTSAVDFIKRNVNDNHLTILGGTEYGNSASLYLTGGDTSINAGSFQLRAQAGSGNKDLVGKPDGTLTWNGNDLNPQRETVIQTSSDVAVASGSAGTELLSFELTKGTWFVNYSGNFSANANGYRHLAISSTSDGGAYNRFCWVRQGNAGNVASSMLSGSSILRVGSTSTFYLRAYQNSGSSLNVSAGVQLFRLSTVS